jgi:calmodulin
MTYASKKNNNSYNNKNSNTNSYGDGDGYGDGNGDDTHVLKNITEEERAEFRDAFKLFDKDGDGVVTVDEIHEVFCSLGFGRFSKADVKIMVKRIDIDGNGTIDLDEFIVLLRSKRTGKYQKMSYEQELRQAFDVFDADGNGDIDAGELAAIMKALGEKLTLQDIEFMIKSVDIDSDGTIDFIEFKKMMHLAPISNEAKK